MGMSTDAIAIFGWAYDYTIDDELQEKLELLWDSGTGDSAVMVGRHCCNSEPYFYFAAHEVLCGRGDIAPLSGLMGADVEAMTKTLKKFCKDNDIEFQEPKFLLLVWADL
jgi:hypothetical protein